MRRPKETARRLVSKATLFCDKTFQTLELVVDPTQDTQEIYRSETFPALSSYYGGLYPERFYDLSKDERWKGEMRIAGGADSFIAHWRRLTITDTM
jgi:hypothetical protein